MVLRASTLVRGWLLQFYVDDLFHTYCKPVCPNCAPNYPQKNVPFLKSKENPILDL